jgi:hypothetical protein
MKKPPVPTRKFALVYQAGIANVFEVADYAYYAHNRKARRVMQNDFHSCAWYARGLKDAGATVRTFACNMAGDVAEQPWSTDLDAAPFSEQFIVVGP